VSANAFGTAVTTFLQVVTVPVLIHAWGTRTFGEWLVLSSVPAFLAMSDWGFENAAGNEMTVELSTGNREGALGVYQTLWLFVTVISAGIVAAVGLTAIFFPSAWLRLGGVRSDINAGAITAILVAHVAVTLQGGLIRSGFRSTGRYALGVVFQNIIRLAEGSAVILTALLGGDPVRAALSMLAVRAVMTLISERQMRKPADWLRVGVRHASTARLRALLPGTAGMMAFPLGFALSLQGMVTLIGIMMGPVAVVAFATVRTLSRLVFQLAGVISSSTLPEVSFAFANGHVNLARSLHRRGFQSVGWLTILLSGWLAVTGGWVLRTWTRGAVQPEPYLIYAMLLVAIGDSLWTASSMIALGAGKYHSVSGLYVLTTALSLLIAGLLLPLVGIMGAPVALLIGTAIMLPFVLHTSLGLSADSYSRFFAAVIRPPSVRALFERPHVTAEEARL
jgi:O-antigen/teichoic acid export membrane protein